MSLLINYYLTDGAGPERAVTFDEFESVRSKLYTAHPPPAFTVGHTSGRMETIIVGEEEMPGQRYAMFGRFPVELWQDNLAREFALGKMLENARANVELDGNELLEELDRSISFQKWNWEWTRVVRRWIFWKRHIHSEEGYYWECPEEEAEFVGVRISWNTTKPIYS